MRMASNVQNAWYDAARIFVVMAAAAAFACADDPATLSEFASRTIALEEREAILEQSQFLQQDTPSRPQLDAKVLRRMDALPQITMKVGSASVYLTHPFAYYGGRQLALAFVEVDGEVHTRVLYRSNSQFGWRMCDATDGGHIGKGFHEFDKQVPIPVTVTLLKMHDDPQTLKSFDNDDSRSQSDLAKHLLHGLTVDRRADQCIGGADGSYYSREYAAFMPSQPMTFSRVSKWLPTASTLLVADPSEVELPVHDQLPVMHREIISFTFDSPAYAKVSDDRGELVGRVFESHDGGLRYLFFEDAEGRAALTVVEPLLPEVNCLGLRSRYLDTDGMDAPLIEYCLQMPAAFGGNKESGYTSNWNYVRELPIIKYYYAEQQRAVPPALEYTLRG